LDTPFSILSLKDFREDQRAFSNKLGENFREWGFCGLKDHGIDTDLLNDTQELFKEFFDLPDDFKKKKNSQNFELFSLVFLSTNKNKLISTRFVTPFFVRLCSK